MRRAPDSTNFELRREDVLSVASVLHAIIDDQLANGGLGVGRAVVAVLADRRLPLAVSVHTITHGAPVRARVTDLALRAVVIAVVKRGIADAIAPALSRDRGLRLEKLNCFFPGGDALLRGEPRLRRVRPSDDLSLEELHLSLDVGDQALGVCADLVLGLEDVLTDIPPFFGHVIELGRPVR